MKNDLLFSFEPEVIVEWMDPYDLIILKLITVFIFIIEILASAILLTFVMYETSEDDDKIEHIVFIDQ